MNCIHCNDTGSLLKSLEGYLDCGCCDVAEERRELEAWAFQKIADCGAAATMWLAYQRGKATAQSETPA